MQIEKPNILVLMATKNGQSFLPQQLDSILQQSLVDVFLLISDDLSTDSTPQIINQYAAKYPNIYILPKTHTPFNTAEQNFYHLIRFANYILQHRHISDKNAGDGRFEGCDFCKSDLTQDFPKWISAHRFDAIAFADQDDIWQHWKLHKHYTIMNTKRNIHGVSSSVTAFSNRKIVEIDKHHRQTQADHLFESAGPGCTFLISLYLLKKVASILNTQTVYIAHDWFIYACCRELGLLWFIDSAKSVLYRQHSNNQMGINKGIRQNLKRLQSIKNKAYVRSTLDILKIFPADSSKKKPKCKLEKIKSTVVRCYDFKLSMVSRMRARVSLAANAWHLRRKPLDKLILCVFILVKIW